MTQIWNSSRPEFLMNFTAIWFSEKTIKEKENQWHFFVFGFVFSFYDRHFVKAAFEFLKKIFRYFERISEPSGFSGRNFWIVLNQPNLSLVLWHLLVTLNFEVRFFLKLFPICADTTLHYVNSQNTAISLKTIHFTDKIKLTPSPTWP